MVEVDSEKMKQELINETQDGSDRISSLQDSIVNHILSFLPTEDVVRASFLSRRWKSLRSPLSKVDLNFERFRKNSRLDDPKKRFAEFVDRMIVIHKGRHCSEVRLVFDISQFEGYSSQIDEWVIFAMTCDCTTLQIDFWGGRKAYYPDHWKLRCYTLAECLFPHKSIENLTLGHCIFRPWNFKTFSSIKLACLKKVHLPGGAVDSLVASSPLLERMFLTECLIPPHFKVHAPESRLHYIVIFSCSTFDNKDIDSFDINFPNLLEFTYIGNMVSKFSLNHPKNLYSASFDFLSDTASDGKTSMFRNVLKDINHVKSLELSRSCLEILIPSRRKVLEALVRGDESWEIFPPMLSNLEHLSLRCMIYNIGEIAGFLRSSPSLQTLSIDLISLVNDDPDLTSLNYEFTDETIWTDFLFPPNGLQHLKGVELKGFEGRTAELDLVNSLLTNSLSLRKMVICKADMRSRYAKVKKSGNKNELKLLKAHQEKTIEHLLAFRRGSTLAEVFLS